MRCSLPVATGCCISSACSLGGRHALPPAHPACTAARPALAHARGITPELVAEGPAPPGGEVDLAIHMRPAPGWHGYWLNPGDAGLPMDVSGSFRTASPPVRCATRCRAGSTIAGLMNYVYERDYAVLVRLKVPANARGVVPLRAEAHWLACTDKICVPEQGILSLDLPVGTGTPNRAQFDAGGRRCRGRWRRSAISRSPATSCASPSRCRPASRTASPICSRLTTAPSTTTPRRASPAPAIR